MGGSFNNGTIHTNQRHIVGCLGGLDGFMRSMERAMGTGRNARSPTQAMTRIVEDGLLLDDDRGIRNYVESLGFPTAAYDGGEVYGFYRRMMVRDGTRLYNEVKAGKRPSAVSAPSTSMRAPATDGGAPVKRSRPTRARDARGRFVSKAKGKESTAGKSSSASRR